MIGRRFYISAFLMIGVVVTIILWRNSSNTLNPLLFFFFYSIPSNAAISLFPHEPVLIHFGSMYPPLLLAIIATSGTIIAGLLDYFLFVPLFSVDYLERLKKTSIYVKAHAHFNRRPFTVLVAAAFTPIPFFPFKFAVFAEKYPLHKYFLAIIIGRFPRYYLLALFGMAFQVPNWAWKGAFLIMLSIYLWKAIPRLSMFFRKRYLQMALRPGIDDYRINHGTKDRRNGIVAVRRG